MNYKYYISKQEIVSTLFSLLIVSSEQRREILFYLEEEPRTIPELRSRFGIDTTHISAKLRELEEYELIAANNKTYRLTTRGRILLNSYRPYADTVEVIGKFDSFWTSHDMSDIPGELLSRIGELRNSRYVEDDIYDMNRTRKLLRTSRKRKKNR
jgi:predicted transcriptional regulator